MFHSLQSSRLSPGGSLLNAPDKDSGPLLMDWPVSYYGGVGVEETQPVNLNQWSLTITGLVEKSVQLNLKDLASFPRIQQNRRLVFADGWTHRASWEGFVVQELLHRVVPKPEARFLIQINASNQVECIPLQALYAQRALFCTRVNGKSLPPIYGGPLKLLVFDRYAHKGLGQIVRLELSDTEIPGFFHQKGYSPDGEIEPGHYYATDLKSVQMIKESIEITQW